MGKNQEVTIRFTGDKILSADAEKIEDDLMMFFMKKGISAVIEDNITGNTTMVDSGEALTFKMDGIDCKTPCPHGKACRIGSFSCQSCEDYGGQVDNRHIICRKGNKIITGDKDNGKA